MNELSTIISTIGFPCFVAVWMLYKGSKDSEALKGTVSELKNAITELTSIVKYIHDGDEDEKHGK